MGASHLSNDGSTGHITAITQKRPGAIVLFFESLLPYLTPRVIEVADVPPAGHIARFDNDVHFQMVRIGSSFLWNNDAEANFTLFLGPDRSPVHPPMEVVSRILVKRRGYRFKPLGDILGGHTIRANLRGVQSKLAANTASMVLYRQKPQVALEPGAPPRWLKARFAFRPKGRDGYGSTAYNWEVVGRRILNSLDDVRVLLADESIK